MSYGGQMGSARYYGGMVGLLLWLGASHAWYMYTPFHPAFYYGPPVYYGGSYYPGQFDFLHLLITIVLVLAAVWLVVSIYKKGARLTGREWKKGSPASSRGLFFA